MGLENIYLGPQSASSFASAIRYDTGALRSLAGTLAARFAGRRAGPMRVLDVGSGSGSFILPVAEFFEERGAPDYRLDCFDASEHMARLFAAGMASTRIPARKVRYLLHDAEDGLGPLRAPARYDLAFVTFVLHYVNNWRRLLDEVVDGLRAGGVLVQAEIVGDFRNIDGQFDVESPILFRQFWSKYFTERAKHSVWAPAISVSDLSPVFTYLRETNRVQFFQHESSLWSTSVTWGSFCGWVADAPLSSLGAGLSPDARLALSGGMREWLRARDVSEAEEVHLTWGIRTSLSSRKTS